MKLLLMDDNEEKIAGLREQCQNQYSDAEIVPVVISESTRIDNLMTKLGDIGQYDYMFTDVNMPTAQETLSLLCELRKNGLLSPIVLISTNKKDRTIPTNILGKNADQNEDLYRRNYLPSMEDLQVMEAFSSKEEIPSCETDRSNLIALSILSQGYLAAHGGEGLDGWDKVPDELKDKIKSKADDTKKKSWWTTALGDNESIIQIELKAVPDDKDKNNGKKKVQDLINAIYTDGDTLPNGALVADAYSALKAILKG